MSKISQKWACAIAIGAIMCPMPIAAATGQGIFSDQPTATQMTFDLVIPFGGPASKTVHNAPRLQLGLAYEPRSRSSSLEYELFRPREKQATTIGLTLDKTAAFMLNGKPVAHLSNRASLNTIETVGVVLGGLALVAGGVILYADSVFDEGPGN